MPDRRMASNAPPSTRGGRLGREHGLRAALVRGVCAMLLGCLACAGTPAQQTARGSRGFDPCPETPGQVTLNLVNEERRLQGLQPLEPDLLLVSAAWAHAEDLARTGRISHEGSDGSTPGQRVTAAGYVWTSVGENVAAGRTSPEEVVAEWTKSEPHRRNLLNPGFTSAGVATVDAPATRWGTYWVMVYAAGPQTPAPGSVRCHP